MRVAIIGAMEQEIALLRDKIEQCEHYSQAGCDFYSGYLHGVQVVLLKSGIGKTAAALGTTLLLSRFQPDVVINTGSAGGLKPDLQIGDIVISDEVRYHDVDVTAFGYEPGQMAGCPPAFSADPHLIQTALQASQQLALRTHRGLIISGDAFINGAHSLTRLRAQFPAVIATEMEATAIGHVCHQFAVPFVVVRAISDVADQDSHISFEAFLTLAARHSCRLVEDMLKTLAAYA